MKLKKIAKELVKDFGIKVKYANLERDDFDGFFAYYEDNFIVVPREEENYYCEDFMEDFKNRYPEVNAHEITISILHEVGHCMVHPNKTCKTEKAVKIDYYHEFDERIATAWAAEYIITHPKKIAKFEKKLKEMLEEG